MKKIDKLLDEIQQLKKKGFSAKKIDALTEGINLIAAEYYKRKAKENARKKALTEATGFAELDRKREASGLPNKEFIEGVGKAIIESSQPDETKNQMMDILGRYVSLMESADTFATRWVMGPLDEKDKKLLSARDIEGFKKYVMERSQMAFRWAAQAKFNTVAELAAKKSGEINGTGYTVARALIDTPDEKLLILKPTEGTENGVPAFAYAARANQPTTMESAEGISAAPASASLLTPEEIAAFRTVSGVLETKRDELAALFDDEEWVENHVVMATELIDDLFSALGVE